MQLLKYKEGTHASTFSIEALLAIFIIWPFGAFLLSCTQINKKGTPLIWVLCGGLFGFTFTTLEGLDSYVYIQRFLSISTYGYNLSDILQGESSEVFLPVYSWLVAQFSSDWHVFYCILGMLFMIPMVGTFRILFKKHAEDFHLIHILLFVILFFTNPIFNINGLRWPLSVWIVSYSVISFLSGKLSKRKLVFFFVLAPLIHWASVLSILLFLFYQILKPQKDIIFYICIFLSYVLQFVFSGFVTNIGDLLGGHFAERVDLYTSYEMLKFAQNNGDNSFLYGLYKFFYNPAILALLLYLKHFVEYRLDRYGRALYGVAIMMFVLANAGAEVGAFSRFYVYFQILSIAFLIRYASFLPSKTRTLFLSALSGVLIFAIANAWITVGRYVTSGTLFYLAPFCYIHNSTIL